MDFGKSHLGLLLASVTAIGSAAHADLIAGPALITPSTSLSIFNFGSQTFPVSQIADGIRAEDNALNGFASFDASGTITLDLNGDFDLSSFVLWNDVNVLAEGIKDFQLKFYDAGDALISTSLTLTGPVGQLSPQTYLFDAVVRGVSKVELAVLSSNVGVVTHIEIREVAFNGTPSAVPVPAALWLLVSGVGGLGLAGRRRRVST